MKRPLLLVAAALAGALVLSACDTSPYAAEVDGSIISQASLQNEMRAWSSNKAWVASFNSSNSQSQGGQGVTVAGAGGAGTYSSDFATGVLTVMVETKILSHRLRPPSPDMLVAARAYNEVSGSSYWDSFPSSVQQLLVQRLAYYAVATPVDSNSATLQPAYQQLAPYLFSSVCYQEAASVSRSQAEAVSKSKKLQGPTVCDDQATFETESRAFQDAVLKLGVGDTSVPIPTSFGYEVVKVTSRTVPGLSQGVLKVLSVITAQTAPTELTDLISHASVKVNPAYGTWSGTDGRINPPTVSNQ